MILTPGDFSNAFEEIKTMSLTHSTCKLVVFVSCLNVDSICAGKILCMMLKRHLIVFQLIPVVGYNDLKTKYIKLDEGISNVLLVGCGSMVDLESFLDIDVSQHVEQVNSTGAPITPDSSTTEPQIRLTRRIYVFDGHRPWNLDNLFGSHMIVCFDDGTAERELEPQRVSYEALVAMEQEQGEDEEEEQEEFDDLASGSEDEMFTRKRKSEDAVPARKRVLLEHEKTIEDYYNQGTTVSMSAAIQVYSLVSTLGESSVDYLWLSIVGTSSLSSNYTNAYESLVPLLKDELNRIQQSDDISSTAESSFDDNRGKKADNTALKVDKDYSLFLLRHWNLYNSFFYSNYVNSKLQLYTSNGKRRLNTMFARMGISLAAANQNWHYLDINLKKKLHTIFRKNLAQFGLTDVIRDGFVRNFGFHGSVSACDFVEAVTALLEYDGELVSDQAPKTRPATPEQEEDEKDIRTLIKRRESQFVANFWRAYDAMDDFDLISKGLKIAKLQQQFIFDKGFEIFQKKMIKNLRIFRLVVLKDNFATNNTVSDHSLVPDSSNSDSIEIRTFSNNAKLFQNPLILTKLGNWILESCAELDKSVLPLVIASLDVDTGTYLVCGLPPKYPNMKGVEEAAEKITVLNTFSLAFQEIANSTGAKARIDSFESSMIEIRKDDLPMFLERLSLSGLV
ncbi:hypothetical protein OGAPHI_006238 [Ogataea philodendri]|uniref:Uncharacterized protein n=1 Tax=Ogataea philodendri TaxID=1378263 RepID=A0A9P8NYS8_9ASCO|nr:uncharacterized protein OGAPHI_006238 [Ogataea philodendri]KAH3662057.1 hypothetical protein OGAPHI_006238 [Ogataea philodendri]